jgi:hypothetical protein
MKSLTATEVRWRVALWASFLVIAIIFAFGAAVQVDFNDPSVPFSQAMESTRWERILPDSRLGEYHLIFAVSMVGLILHTFLWSWRNRLGAMAIGFLAPIFTIGPVMLWVAVVSPLMVFNALMGNVDGEFYGEGTLMVAAVGLWMLVCLVFGIREALAPRRMRKSTPTELPE